MQEDANRGVPRDVGQPVTNASTASARDAETHGSFNRLVMAGAGLVLLAILASLLF